MHFINLHQALLPGGWTRNVRIGIENGLIASIQADAAFPSGERVEAIGLPGMPNLHSHAFQRGMAGLAEVRGQGDDSFWTWREVMYRFVDRMDPDQLSAVAALAYVEMLESGFTRVGEFHYLHHDRSGAPFANPAAMTQAIVAAAQETGIGLTHLPVFYAHSGFGGQAPNHGQRRFINDIDGYARLLDAAWTELSVLPDGVLGLAPHSLRAVTAEQLRLLEPLAAGGPIHTHIAEQVKEVEECLAWSGQRPVEWLLDHARVDQRWCLVHATHMTQAEVVGLAQSGAVAGLCPITEANLGDGLFPARAFLAAGGRFGIGSDSNVLIDMTEELRWLEYGQRLDERARNVMAGGPGRSTGLDLYNGALRGGAQALGTGCGLAVGNSADLFTLDPDHPSIAGREGTGIVDALLFAAGRQAIDCVWRRGKQVVTAGRHHAREAVTARYRSAIAALMA